ncbi:MAG: AAA family ATPase, partial [Promethearchaeota archaeon]
MTSYWLIRAGTKGEYWEEWKKKEIISIGWDIGEDLQELSKEEIKKRIELKYDSDPDKTAGQLRSFAGIHNDFTKNLRKGAFVIVLGDATIEGIAEIIDDRPYIYNSEGIFNKDIQKYWKRVKYLYKDGSILIQDLPDQFRQGGLYPIHLVATLKRYNVSKKVFKELIKIITKQENILELANIEKEVNYIIQYAIQLNKYVNDPSILLEDIKKLPISYLKERRDHFKRQKLGKDGKNSVNTVKFLILDKIINNQVIDIETIEAIKQNIRYKNDEYFSDYPEIQRAVINLERKGKNYFQSFTNFHILIWIYYERDKKIINNILKEIGNHLQENVFPEGLNFYISDFVSNNNYGRDYCWMPFFPQIYESFKDCYQLIIFFHPGYINFGLGHGDNVKKIPKQREIMKIEDFNYEKFKNNFIKYIPEFNRLNSIELSPSPQPGDKLSSLSLYENTNIDIKRIINALKLNYQIILMGPPGTSKSYLAHQIANELTENNDNIYFVQFHPEYSYDDFIEGKEPIGGEKFSL